MTVVDVHTHMVDEGYLQLLARHGDPHGIGTMVGGVRTIDSPGLVMPVLPAMLDYAERIRHMDSAGVDVAIVSLTCPNVYWGDATASTRAAQVSNDAMAAAQQTHPDRIRFLASLPWQHPDEALVELERAVSIGAVGVMVLATIGHDPLDDARFAPIWEQIEVRGLPVLIHPAVPPGHVDLRLGDMPHLLPVVGFTLDTTLALARLVMSGFIDEYPSIPLIASHGGGTFPYLRGRMTQMAGIRPEKAARTPSEYVAHLYYDSVSLDPLALQLCIDVAGLDHVLFGTDFCPLGPAQMEQAVRDLSELDARNRAAIGSENAIRLFDL